ncbi:hypothetical protein [Aquimarina sp. RZ0]|uniref:hypothetical protein n=1 Tax=Aquimarina sp. RZ0 TaxID=2607730 RepID=UPI0011F2C47C|nr:hypothetical protein [Aquimarina sp. RZ0]KAA1245668.1 hypothetical protein F0000_11290 [Aquimarina sp. RZ0]
MLRSTTQSTREIENVANLIKGNVNFTKELIHQIDHFLETNYMSESVINALVSKRNAYAIAVMNFTRVHNQVS